MNASRIRPERDLMIAYTVELQCNSMQFNGYERTIRMQFPIMRTLM